MARRRRISQRPPAPAARAEEKPPTGEVVQDLPLWGQFFQVGGTLSPEGLSGIIAAANSGRPYQLIDLVHEIREKDGHIHACLTTLELDVASLEWQAVPLSAVRGKPRKSEQKLAKQVQAAIRECGAWQQMLAHLTGEGECHGHATSELLWRMYDGGEPLLRGWMIPDAKNVQANRFGFSQTTGALLFDAAGNRNVDVGGVDLLASYPLGKFVQHRPRINGDVAIREGLDRMLAWAGMFRNHGLKGWLTESENAWKPIRLIQYLKTASKEDIAFAKQLAQKLTTSGGAAIPETLKALVEYPKTTGQSGGSRFRELEEWLGMELSKAILGHTLLLESGDRGARSLGEVGYRMSQARRDARALALAVTVNAMLVRPLVAFNVSGKRAPLLLPDVKTQVDLVQFANAVDVLAKRMKVGANWVREETRMPEPEADEETLTTGAQPGPFGEPAAPAEPQQPAAEPPPDPEDDPPP